VFGSPVVIFLPEAGRISFRKRTADQLPVPTSEEAVAQNVFDSGRKAGPGAELFPEASAAYLPLKGTNRIVGVLCVPPGGSNIFGNERQHLLDLFANQTAVAIERTLNENAAESARFQMQAEEMRSSLLSAVSHDLRTPLASITGAASTLRAQGEKLAPEVREELLDSISDEAQRMSRLVGNLLDMTRLESGVQLRSELCPLEEIVGEALQRLESQLRHHRVVTQLPENLPPVPVDDVLMGQVIVNLMENAIKYTPAGTAIELIAEEQAGAVELAVLDRGPGFTPGDEKRIFDKFYRGQNGGVRGAGLGLAICKAIVTAHGGTIEAANRPEGGAVFRIRLPLKTAQENPL
jgi:two-component system sensor histidine kinase KdpD